jgi:hypothetical protein
LPKKIRDYSAGTSSGRKRVAPTLGRIHQEEGGTYLGLSLALVGLLAKGVAFFHDADVELELLLARFS